MFDPRHFLHSLSALSITNTERAIALLWWYGLDDHSAFRTPTELAADMEAAGYARQNTTRLRGALQLDHRTATAGRGSFRVKINARTELDDEYGALAESPPMRRTSSVLPLELFHQSRGYIEKVVLQLNASYDGGLYDCSAVMSRRLLETLIIEAYESRGEAKQLKDANGHFFMFAGLLAKLEEDAALGMSRNGLTGLKDFKRLGDLSAHNRRFNARRDDIDRVRDGLRVASEELLHIAGMA